MSTTLRYTVLVRGSGLSGECLGFVNYGWGGFGSVTCVVLGVIIGIERRLF